MDKLFDKLVCREEKLAVIGLGYVGLPLAVAFSKHLDVIGFDLNNHKISLYKQGIDVTNEVGSEKLKRCNVQFTADDSELSAARIFIVAVPTPICRDKNPDLVPIIGATKIIGGRLQKGSIIIYESTVYPGLTEEVCIPLLEKESGLIYSKDFKVGYSPERINPGDKVHTVENIVKIVSGTDEESLNIVANIYSLIVKAGVYKAESIKVAEAAKVIENTQRDINIAFMNELSIIFSKLGIDTHSVLKAAGTKWNFLKFTPGLVGGHCIGVDPYYLTYKAEEMGYHPQVILSGRRINDGMGKYVAENTVKQLIKADRQIKGSKVLVIGLTFKENVPDVRNSKVVDIINELKEYGIEVLVCDEVADKEETKREYAIDLIPLVDVKSVSGIIFAVAHDIYKNMDLSEFKSIYESDKPVLIDVKGVFSRDEAIKSGYVYWRL